MADAKTPLTTSVADGTGSGTVDYDAIFSRDGVQQSPTAKFATQTFIGEVHNLYILYTYFYYESAVRATKC